MNQLRNELMMDNMNENNYAPASLDGEYAAFWHFHSPNQKASNQKGHNFKSKGDKK